MEAARPAVADDLTCLARLAEQAVAEQSGERGGSVWAQRETRALPAEASLGAAIDDPDQLVLAGTIDHAVIGYAVVCLELLRNDEVLGVVTDLFVEPEARGVGVGEQLVEMVLDWCRQRRCCGVDALALPGNRDTKNFFETFGFTARALIVHRPLAPSPDVER
ncbi:MAG: GNAT family N-acetyltransferase [Actinobacteria bacterium]|nr:GNAT family N-acetyltransferase [Actinomycetota bacterium]